MFCSQCGKKLKDTMLFCPNCGVAIEFFDDDDEVNEVQQDWILEPRFQIRVSTPNLIFFSLYMSWIPLTI